VDGIENPLAVEIQVDPALNKGANVLGVYTGTALLGKLNGFGGTEFKGTSTAHWSRGQVRIRVPAPGRIWTFLPIDGPPEGHRATFFHGGTVVASLASIYNKNVANNAGWAVDGADIQALGIQDNGLVIEAKLALRDSDGFLYRLAYQVTALGQQNPAPLSDPDILINA